MIKAIFLAASLWANGPAFSADEVKSDSLRLETVNGQTFIVHLVGEKETLFALSKRYGVTVARILEFNPTADGGIEAGQLLKVPYVPKGRTQTAEGTVHKVQPKETLFSISRMYNVSVDDIKAWNNIKDSGLSVGQDILIKKGSANAQQQVTTSNTPKQQSEVKMTHTVAQGETLYSISRQYNVPVDKIKEWNGLTGNELKLSQTIYVQQPMFNQQQQSQPQQPVASNQKQETKSVVTTTQTTTPTLAL